MQDLQEDYTKELNGAVAGDEPQGQADGCVDALRRLQADFENYRKRVERRQGEESERRVAALIERLLPVLDAFELGRRQPGRGRAAVRLAVGRTRDPGPGAPRSGGRAVRAVRARAVVHDQDGDGTQMVSEVLRPGYRYKTRLLRPAMVKVGRAQEEVRRNGCPSPVA